MKIFNLLLLVSIVGCQSVKNDSDDKGLNHRDHCKKPFVFFDLGETLVDTVTNNYKKIYYLPGTESYLRGLSQNQFKIGMLINIPESWGADHAAKLLKLKDFIKTPWAPVGQEFGWNLFDESLILLPSKDVDRKPKPILFLEASTKAKAAGCQAVFQGEEEAEVKIAMESGMHSYLVKRQKNASGELAPVFMTQEQLIQIQSAKAD